MRRSGRTSSGELVWGGGVPWAGNSGVGADGWRVLGLSEVWVRRLVSVLCCLCVAWLCNEKVCPDRVSTTGTNIGRYDHLPAVSELSSIQSLHMIS